MLILYADGGLVQGRKGQGPGAYWSVGIEDEGGFRVVRRQSHDPRLRTSMEAECAALADALRCLEELPAQPVQLFSDCRTLVEFLSPEMTEKGRRVRRRFRGRLQHVKRELWQLWRRIHARGHALLLSWIPRTEMQLRLGH